MKKRLLLTLAAALLLAGCGNAGSGAAQPTAAPEATAVPEASATPETVPGTDELPGDDALPEEAAPSAYLSGLVDDLYAACPVELMMVETRAVTDDDPAWLQYQTGLGEEWAGRIDEAVISESMTGSQAYSLILVRMPTAEDAQAVAEAMLDGIDMGKWVCVRADKARAVTFGEVAALAMADSTLVDVDALLDALPGLTGTEFAFDMSRAEIVD